MSTPTAADRLGRLDYVQWSADVLGALSIAPGSNNLPAMVAWCLAEGGHNENSADWNPLGTTITASTAGLDAGAVLRSINSHGVKAYRSRADGLAATVATLRLPRYTAVVAQLRANADPLAVSAAVAASGWGTGPGIAANVPRARSLVAASPGVRPAQGDITIPGGTTIPLPGPDIGVPSPGDVLDPFGVIDKLKGLADFTELLTNPRTWIRVQLVVGGGALMIAGVLVIVGDLQAVQSAVTNAIGGTIP